MWSFEMKLGMALLNPFKILQDYLKPQKFWWIFDINSNLLEKKFLCVYVFSDSYIYPVFHPKGLFRRFFLCVFLLQDLRWAQRHFNPTSVFFLPPRVLKILRFKVVLRAPLICKKSIRNLEDFNPMGKKFLWKPYRIISYTLKFLWNK